MKETGALIVGLNQELSVYLREHPEELPPDIDKNSLRISCAQYLIEHIESYTHSPYKDKFLWRVQFKNSESQEYEYLYFITYKAIYNGEAGIVEAKLINKKGELSSSSHLYN
jgi:hypothetical protein